MRSITLSEVSRWVPTGCALLLMAAVSVAAEEAPSDDETTAEESAPTETSTRESSYPGVVPGSGHAPPRARAMKGKARLLTWPGFQPKTDGTSRFFLQTSRPVEVVEKRGKKRFELLLRETRVHLSNTLRPLVTRHFDTPVVRALVKRRGRKGVAIVFDLREDVSPVVSQKVEKDGYNYVYVDFPASGSGS